MSINTAKQFKILAKDSMQSAKFDHAIEILQEALKQNPEDRELFELLGDAYKAIENREGAIISYTDALNLDPGHLGIALKLATASLTGANYIDALKVIHQCVKPERYIEIGVCKGVSFQLADVESIAIGIDPAPQLDLTLLPKKHCVIAQTSDDYFNANRIMDDLQGKCFDLAFLDGMHLFEFALRDFINLEKYAAVDSVICIHDLYPLSAATATRERNTAFWSGDVWKLGLCLQEYRPDLNFSLLPCPPTGLAVVTDLDASSNVLAQHYDEILEKYLDLSFDILMENKAEKLSLVGMDHPLLFSSLLL